MRDGADDLQQQLTALRERLAELERRLAQLESGHNRAAGELMEAGAGASLHDAGVATGPSSRLTLPLVGRLLLILAGAFLLRALTESKTLPQVAGTTLGIAYAGLWILLAAGSGRRERRVEATVHATAGVLIGYPLLWEVTTQFHLLSAGVSAIVLAGMAAVGLYVAARYRLGGAATLIAVGAGLTSMALAFATDTFFAFVGVVLVLGLATVWLAYTRGWIALAMAIAVLADMAVVMVTAMLVLRGPDEPRIIALGPMLVLQLGLILVYLGSVAGRTLATARDIGALEVVQALATLGVGLGGALLVGHTSPSHGAAVGSASLVLGAACYAISFASIDRRSGRRLTFIFYSSVALIFIMVGFAGLLVGARHAVALALAAGIMAVLGAAWSRATLSLHGAVLVVAAAIVSGTLATALGTLAGTRSPTMDWISTPVLVVLAVTLLACVLHVGSLHHTWGRFVHVPKLAVLALLIVGFGGVAVSLLAVLVSRSSPDRGVLAVVRTGVLAAAALGLALAGRQSRAPEAAMLVYPVLLVGGAKLLFEDLRTGRPATLVFSLLLYGVALIVAPRLVRRRSTA